MMMIAIDEFSVVILEFAMSCCVMKSVYAFSLKKLFLTILMTNAVSFTAGVVYVFTLI